MNRLLAVLLLAPSLLWANTETIAQLDQLYHQRAELKANQVALELCEKELQTHPTDLALLWRAARASWWIGTQLLPRPERLKAFQKGVRFGEAAVKQNSDSVEAHFWLGSNHASYGHAKGAFTSLFLIKTIRKEMKEVLRLSPSYMGGGADRILGILDYQVPAMMGGNHARGLKHLEQSLVLDPNNPVTLFYLADYYADRGNPAKAKTYLQTLQTNAPSPDFAPELGIIQPQVRELSKKLGV